jgi:hypothetical protein
MKMVGEICAAIPQAYEGSLHGQVGQWWTLPSDLVAALQPYYGVDLRGVKFAFNIRTSNGAAQTFGNAIYFLDGVSLPARNAHRRKEMQAVHLVLSLVGRNANQPYKIRELPFGSRENRARSKKVAGRGPAATGRCRFCAER